MGDHTAFTVELDFIFFSGVKCISQRISLKMLVYNFLRTDNFDCGNYPFAKLLRVAEMKNPRGRPRIRDKPNAASSGTMVDRALTILEAISAGSPGGLTTLAHRLRLPVSTVHRFLLLLERRGYVTMDSATQTWDIGPQAFQVGNSYLRQTRLTDVARSRLAELGALSGETANLLVRQGQQMIVIAQVESHNPLRAFFRLGTQIPCHCSAAGKAALGALSDSDIATLYPEDVLTGFTPKTILSVNDLKRCLVDVREKGWALDDEEHVDGMRCVAAAVSDRTGATIGAISLTAPVARFGPAEVDAFGAWVLRAALDLTMVMNGVPG